MKKPPNSTWFYLALASAVVYGFFSFFQFVILKKTPKLNAISLAIGVAFIECVIGVIIYLCFKIPQLSNFQKGVFENYNKDLETLCDKKNIPLGIGGATCNAIGLATLLLGYLGAPNPGFTDAISDGYVIPQALFTYLIYKVKMNGLQLLGVVFAVFGVYLLST